MSRERILERARALVELGGHPRTPKHEAESAAVAACRLIREHRLLDLAAKQEKTTTAERRSGTIVEGPLLVLIETEEHWRFVKTRGATASQNISWVPKTAVLSIDWIDDPVERARIPGGKSSRVARSVTISTSWVRGTARKAAGGW